MVLSQPEPKLFTVRLTKNGHRLSIEAVEFLFLAIFKSHLDVVLGRRVEAYKYRCLSRSLPVSGTVLSFGESPAVRITNRKFVTQR